MDKYGFLSLFILKDHEDTSLSKSVMKKGNIQEDRGKM